MSIRQRTGAYGSSVPRVRARVKAHPVALSRTVFAASVFVLVFFLLLLYLWQGTAILSLTAQRESARATLTSVNEVNRYLEFKVDQAFSLDRIEQIAREKLHMIDPKAVRYVKINDGS